MYPKAPILIMKAPRLPSASNLSAFTKKHRIHRARIMGLSTSADVGRLLEIHHELSREL